MTKRSLSAIILSIIIAIEIFSFLNATVPTKVLPRKEGSTSSLFGATVVDKAAQSRQNSNYGFLIGATIIVGGIITFLLSDNKIESSSSVKVTATVKK
ncbi:MULTISPECIES: hypothetical protein [unclassified Paenibacillus]|uniref:hypothetical protein n=1 Tax=unclassified Paenibacillus TaxID=185978 RepID=UPI002784B2E3|nr:MULTISPECIES: hypothetical protein [unclassified Paenibacillus]MDQ0896305.1 hypothetical protein [Paenibacillus sp. V4I7]MDQ0913767.1 hypothetical protein [Paenibacillus sp. V4I5]